MGKDKGLTAREEQADRLSDYLDISRQDADKALSVALGEEKSALGKVGQIITGTVLLAIVVPFIGIIWAWALNVARGLGGF